ncbi:acetylglutamate/acetylaminoadipate kinase [Haloarcula montana]|uniref:acetylglutamate/acetylaminoadipate kinase n=1 Tax=Haloarcula montana TaxID=3111776 RepID=UPI002D78450F|nr:acetylglutamate/acetylaminoadipate kinase [Haloarcula sp. GH36]
MTVVIKVGGARAVDPAGALADVAALVSEGQQVVVVHGGSTKVDETLERLGIEPEYVETPSGVVGRFTDEATMEVFEMAFGHLNTQLVAGLQSEGVDAVGLTGVDGKLLYGPRKSAVRVVEDGTKKIKRGDHSGTIKRVNGDLLESLLSDGYTPVAAPPMAGDDDGDVIPVNTDADRSAAAIAAELDATLVLLTDVAGVYEDPDDPETLIDSVETGAEWAALEDAAEGFMGRKVMAAEEALAGGAPEVVVADANADEPISSALEGSGTHLHASALSDTEEQQ